MFMKLFEMFMKWFGWIKTDEEKPRKYEFVRVNSYPFGIAMYCEYGNEHEFYYGGVRCNPAWWRRIKNGDEISSQVYKEIEKRTDTWKKKL